MRMQETSVFSTPLFHVVMNVISLLNKYSFNASYSSFVYNYDASLDISRQPVKSEDESIGLQLPSVLQPL